MGCSEKHWEVLGGFGRLWEALGGIGRLWEALWVAGYVAMWLCGYVAMWLCGYVAMWLSVSLGEPVPRLWGNRRPKHP